ncbi:hypothetical protein SDC9_204125 [bioreactor metagenome]|uniref:Uncharacterized protein n=1 Tax=bioreactor metagenome TaxID=1076179 RepID=A0A645IZ03_9ZZZZ
MCILSILQIFASSNNNWEELILAVITVLKFPSEKSAIILPARLSYAISNEPSGVSIKRLAFSVPIPNNAILKAISIKYRWLSESWNASLLLLSSTLNIKLAPFVLEFNSILIANPKKLFAKKLNFGIKISSASKKLLLISFSSFPSSSLIVSLLILLSSFCSLSLSIVS